jgi:hypothetical protein
MQNPFVYRSPPPMNPNEERFRRFFLMGLSNRELNEVLGVTPHIHCTNKRLIDLILEKEFG